MFKRDWLVYIAYRDYPNRSDVVHAVIHVTNASRRDAEIQAVQKLCFAESDGVDFRSVLFAKPVKIRKWAK